MVGWLGDWLRDIIAVILLAVFVELLLPNKAMLRYARLVIGLFILLTILSPILKLLQSDVSARLDGIDGLWSETAMMREVPMTGLGQIRRDAEQLSEKRNLEAAGLAEKTLEDAMKNELTQRGGAPVESVDASLKWVDQSGVRTPYISQVVVTLKAAGKEEGGEGEGEATVEEVEPVSVMVDVEGAGGEASREAGAEEPAGEAGRADEPPGESGRWTRADPATAAAIGSIIARGWGVGEEQIVVRLPAGREATH
ncbi:stage III sporulation protein AF [Paenibacillus arenilitoris]|uniref:Stage III sporulation protein AF n=1 Tax=Paenibacillus arenilitoris TaxID=2772299 RepID=A0A927H6I9_9BACL|nr:stage III sporulation protein AF [Paenibacillus arenilitoris]MBD2869552.1 stage III sporulation protein AF [Paenibacillus arenilitoris]